MSVEEMPTRRRAVRGLPPPRPAPPVDADNETSATNEPPPVEAATTRPPAPAGTLPASESPDAAAAATPEIPPALPAPGAGRERDQDPPPPARHARRDPRTFRMYTSLYERLTTLVRELEDTGYRTDRTEVVHALLHFQLPRDPEEARTLIRRFRREQLD